MQLLDLVVANSRVADVWFVSWTGATRFCRHLYKMAVTEFDDLGQCRCTVGVANKVMAIFGAVNQYAMSSLTNSQWCTSAKANEKVLPKSETGTATYDLTRGCQYLLRSNLDAMKCGVAVARKER